MADYKDQQFQMNEFAPYAQAYQEGRQMTGAGFENIYGALSGIANITMANQYANQDPAALPLEPTRTHCKPAISTLRINAWATGQDTWTLPPDTASLLTRSTASCGP